MVRRADRSRRIRRRIPVLYGREEPRFTGYSGNLSSSGVMIRAVRVFGKGEKLNLELHLPDGRYRVQGQVRWARKGKVELLGTGRIGMGLKFIDPPAEFLEALSRIFMGLAQSVPR